MGFNLFHAIAKAANAAVDRFKHITHDLAHDAASAAHALSLPVSAGAGIIELLMKATAGNRAARDHVRSVLARGEPWGQFVHAMSGLLKGHPDFAAFQAHSKKTTQAVHGLCHGVGADWWDAPGAGDEKDWFDASGIARPAPPTGGGMPRAQLLARLRAQAPRPAAPAPADAAAASDSGVPGDGGDGSQPDDSLEDAFS